MASKLHERIFVENCLSHLGPDYVIAEERKSPDLIISKGDERFGIEVAQVFRDQSPHGSPTKARESRRVQYLNRLASKYYSCDGLPLLVKANISGPPERDIGAVVDRLKVERLPSTSGKGRFEMGCSTFHLMALPAEAGPYQRWICINNSVAGEVRWHPRTSNHGSMRKRQSFPATARQSHEWNCCSWWIPRALLAWSAGKRVHSFQRSKDSMPFTSISIRAGR